MRSPLFSRRAVLAVPLLALLPSLAPAQELAHPLIPYTQGGTIVLTKGIHRNDPKQSHYIDFNFSAETPKEERFTATKVTESGRTIVMSHHHFDRLLLGSASASASAGALSVRAGGSYHQQVVFDARTINIVWWARIEFPESLAGSVKLTKDGQDALKGLDACGVVKRFGTDIVTGITREARVALVQSITCSSEEKCRRVSAYLRGAYGTLKGAGEVTAAVKTLDERSHETFYYSQNGLVLEHNAIDCLVEPGKRQAEGFKKALAAIDSTACPIKCYRRASLATRPEFSAVKGLAEVIEGDPALARKREEVIGWLEEAVVFHDLLEQLKASKADCDDGGRAAAFGKQVVAVKRWLAKPTLPGPKLHSTKPTKADVEGALVRSRGWVFGQFHQHQRDGKIVIDFRCSPAFDVLWPDLVTKIEMVTAKDVKGGIAVRPEDYQSYRKLAELVERFGSKDVAAVLNENHPGRDENSPYVRRNTVAETLVGKANGPTGKMVALGIELIRHNHDRKGFTNSRYDAWVEFFDNRLPEAGYELHVTDKWGHKHVVSLGRAKDAPGIAEAEAAFRPKSETK